MPNVYVGNGKCNVAECNEIGDYENPHTHSLYCDYHARLIGHRIVYSNSPYIIVDLVKIKDKGLTPSRKKMEKELLELKFIAGKGY
jgi:hypothetical protein